MNFEKELSNRVPPTVKRTSVFSVDAVRKILDSESKKICRKFSNAQIRPVTPKNKEMGFLEDLRFSSESSKLHCLYFSKNDDYHVQKSYRIVHRIQLPEESQVIIHRAIDSSKPSENDVASLKNLFQETTEPVYSGGFDQKSIKKAVQHSLLEALDVITNQAPGQ